MISGAPCWRATHAPTHSQKDKFEGSPLPNKPPPRLSASPAPDLISGGKMKRPRVFNKVKGQCLFYKERLVCTSAALAAAAAAGVYVQLVDTGLHPIPLLLVFCQLLSLI